MSAEKWTESQKDAITARGGTLLVSAAAGSGKTAVLVQRVIERITDREHPADADRLLVVTFTKAAASEMRGRIEAAISGLLEADPFNVRLQRQQILLSRAHISTIDSFCSDLVKENFYLLGISPDFRILDDGEMAVLRSEAVTRVLDEYYGKQDPAFLDFAEAFSSGRDDGKIGATVNELYDFVRAHPFPKRWLEEKAALYRADVPAPNSVWGETVLSFAKEAADYCVSVTRRSLSLAESDPQVAAAYSDALRSDLSGLEGLREDAEKGRWDPLRVRAENFAYQKFRPLRGHGEDPVKNAVSAGRKEVKDAVSRIAGLLCASQRQCGEDVERLSHIVAKLFEVTERFSEILDGLKAERRAADFGDLEHWALKLLVTDTGAGFERTDQAEEISSRFDEIMVDEYQDTNEAQEMIFRAVSKEEKNLFLVGDVKQSIYRFREAMPQLFLRRRAACLPYDREKPEFPARVVLGRNFRSRPGVTGTVNFVFRQLMSRQAGEMDYTKDEELVPGAEYPPSGSPEAELDVIDLSASEGESGMIAAESRLIAERIYALTDGSFPVTDHGAQRPALYRDCCVLLRSANRYAHEYARELTALGIPAWADTAGGFFEAYEVGVALSLLRVVDNPLLDIPLLSVMMSPVYGFTPDDMARIRVGSRPGRLYQAVARAAEEGDARAGSFLADMEGFRTFAATMPADRLIRTVFTKTGLPDLVQSMTGGDLRLANLRLLLEYARRYEDSGFNGLSGFLRYLDRLQKSGADLSAASTVSESANVVRIMSVHHAKGLEFPVCFLAGCARSFHRETAEVVLHPDLGPGLRLKDPTTGSRYTTLPREAAALELERDGMSEELRILYVALTRAREKLVMVTAVKDAAKTLAKLSARLTEEERIQPYVVRGASSISDWLLLCALRHPDGRLLRDMAGAPPGAAVPAEERWDVRVVRPREEQPGDAASVSAPVPPDPALRREIEARLDYRYPYAALRGVCAKVAASDLAAGEFSERFAASSRPAFLEKTGLTPAQRGTALHAFMQFADFRSAAADPGKELERLVREGYLTPYEAEAVDLAHAERFFESGLAKRILVSGRVEREYRFTVEIPASDANPGLVPPAGDERVVLQGAVDCAFEESGGIVIVDFKTDRTNDPAGLWRRYRGQLALYRRALTQCTGKTVKECLLYSFSMDREISQEINS